MTATPAANINTAQFLSAGMSGSDTRREADAARRAANAIERAAAVCRRCRGKGELREYRHVEGGVCFKCGGNGVGVPTRKQVKEIAALHAQADLLESIAAPLIDREVAVFRANAAAAGVDPKQDLIAAVLAQPQNRADYVDVAA